MQVFILLVVAVIYSIFRARQSGGQVTWWIVTGLLFGLATLTRTMMLILLPLVWYAAVTAFQWRRGALFSLVTTGVALAVVGCWTARNWNVHHRFVLVDTTLGYNLYASNNPKTPLLGSWRVDDMVTRDPTYKRVRAMKSELGRNDAFIHEAITYIKENPVHSLILGVTKALGLWVPDFFVAGNVRSGSFGPIWRPLGKPALVLTFAAYLFVVVMAIKSAWKRRREWTTRFIALAVLISTLPHFVVYGLSRYHLPMIPLLILLASPEIQEMLDRRPRRREVQAEAA